MHSTSLEVTTKMQPHEVVDLCDSDDEKTTPRTKQQSTFNNHGFSAVNIDSAPKSGVQPVNHGFAAVNSGFTTVNRQTPPQGVVPSNGFAPVNHGAQPASVPNNGHAYRMPATQTLHDMNGQSGQNRQGVMQKAAAPIEKRQLERAESVATTTDQTDAGTVNEDDDKSLFDDHFPEIGDDRLLQECMFAIPLCHITLHHRLTPLLASPDICTLEEARYYRSLLRSNGPRALIDFTIESGKISARKLITAFGCLPPSFMEDAEDDAFYPYIQWALIREMNKRAKLNTYNTVNDAITLLRNSKNIMVLTGAGISTSLGIPDFRSKDIGLYSKLEHLGLNDPQDVFEIETFHNNPEIFYSVAKEIIPDAKRFTPTHAFIKLLQDKGKLLTNYSQNIDNIEGVAGLLPEKLIQCHGSFATASCTKCHAKVPGEEIFPDIRADIIPRCKRCLQNSDTASKKRKRNKNGLVKKKKKGPWEDSSDEGEAYNMPEAGVMKPDITFFGEALPNTFHERLVNHDKDLVDLVVVIGTSLKVAPVSDVVDFLHDVPSIYISREAVRHIYFDIDLLGDCDIVVSELCRQAGWDLKHEMIPEGQKTEITADENFPSRWVFKQIKPEKVVQMDENQKNPMEKAESEERKATAMEVVEDSLQSPKKERKLLSEVEKLEVDAKRDDDEKEQTRW